MYFSVISKLITDNRYLRCVLFLLSLLLDYLKKKIFAKQLHIDNWAQARGNDKETIIERKIVINVLYFSLDMYCGCLKEPSD